jgi:carboxymethylenebutenolidase
MKAESVTITGHGGDEIEAYFATPTSPGPHPGVVVIHHMPGYDESTKEITRRFAAHGYLALCPNLHWREAPGLSPDDAAAVVRARRGTPDDQLLGDVEGAATYLKSLASSNGKLATIGFCSGGRQSFLAACTLPLDAAVNCYGAFVVAAPPPEAPTSATPILDLAKNLSCPLLGLFGKDDTFPTSAEVDELEGELVAQEKTYEFHSYEGAGHAFFATDRPSYRPDAANAGWQAIWQFFGQYLSA